MTPDLDQRITRAHRQRSAVVYVRQSDPKQVQMNSESTRLQRGLRERAIAFGWPSPVLIDEDLGVSAGGYAERPGFQRLLSMVAMKEVGIILCMDASRLSRNSKDWAHLLELCAYFNTLIADLEQIYDLARSNDRLVMGIKGTVSEMELSILRTRMRTGQDAKAARGELRFLVPTGYVHDPLGRIVFDPDQRVQASIRQMFDQFGRCTSVRQLALWYRDTNTLFPVRRRRGTSWEIPSPKTLQKLLVHPIYSGTYAYGRRATTVEYVDGRLVKRLSEVRPKDQWQVCLRDHHPAYVSWESFLANEARVAENRPRWNMQENQGAIREGMALLAGLLRCGQCGARLNVNYKLKTNPSALYSCDGGAVKGSKRCASFGSKNIDRAVSDELCRVLEPLSLEAAQAAEREREGRREEQLEGARLQVQAAQYEADRAFDQFDQVDPRNRLVADTLEQRLNARLSDLQVAKQKLGALTGAAREMSPEQRDLLREVRRVFRAVWDHPRADPRLRKRLIRSAVEEILVTPRPDQHMLDVVIHWKGGAHTKIQVKRRARPTPKERQSLEECVRLLAREIEDGEIARILNMKGLRTTKGLRWTKDRVLNYRRAKRIKGGRNTRQEGRLTQAQVAIYLGISRNGVLGLARRGAITIHQITEFAPWNVAREELDSEPVQALVAHLKAHGRLPKGGCPENSSGLFA